MTLYTKCAKTKRVTEKVSRDFTTVILRNNDSKTDLTGGTLCGSARFSCAAGSDLFVGAGAVRDVGYRIVRTNGIVAERRRICFRKIINFIART